MLTTFCNNVNVGSVRVYPPKRYILLCGGEVSHINDARPLSLRDAYLRGGAIDALKNSEPLQIEEIEDFFDKGAPYVDLVKFELDIAQICELVLLFSESPGSFAELGSFSMLSGISEKLLLVVQSKYLNKSTFITKGPVANLRRDYPKSVFSFADSTVGMASGQIDSVDPNLLVRTLSSPVEQRLQETENRTTLDVTKFNHLCKVYVGLLREAYCLKDDELLLLLSEFGFEVDNELLDRVSFCCSAIRWAASATSGFDRVHFAKLNLNEAAKFEFKEPLLDKTRRRSDFRAYWEENDPDRVAAVDQERQRP
ncbi:retron St85 family effector protein [Sphingomonas sp. S1-29]|uniref:retron St85 family effector protein n=1 Tax=Sphingomonas sp. S1-29 TaxID=2991074 RepID=UPI00223F740C|nr:retron St85 family effector protein [Sphingomonas sp. S1-29]UZK69967.1 retron St85 family effector protein [Sphingomonas sp. S1-29]